MEMELELELALQLKQVSEQLLEPRLRPWIGRRTGKTHELG